MVFIISSCRSNDTKQIEDNLPAKENELIKFIRLYESFTDATYEWHKETNYNMVIKTSKVADSLCIKIFGVASGDIWPISKSKYCYLVDNHYVFSDTLLHSMKTLSIDSVCEKININLYQDYKRTKGLLPPIVIWDCETLKIQYVNEKLRTVQFVWGD